MSTMLSSWRLCCHRSRISSKSRVHVAQATCFLCLGARESRSLGSCLRVGFCCYHSKESDQYCLHLYNLIHIKTNTVTCIEAVTRTA